MKKFFLIAFLICSLCLLDVYAQSHDHSNVPGKVIIEDNVDLTISGAGLGNDKIDFVLKYYQHPDDPDNLYWKLDIDSLKLTEEVSSLLREGHTRKDFIDISGNNKVQLYYEVYEDYVIFDVGLELAIFSSIDSDIEMDYYWNIFHIFKHVKNNEYIFDITEDYAIAADTILYIEFLGLSDKVVPSPFFGGRTGHKFKLHFNSSFNSKKEIVLVTTWDDISI